MELGPNTNFGFIEIIVFAAFALGFGIWQYWSISREIARDKEKAARQALEKSADEN